MLNTNNKAAPAALLLIDQLVIPTSKNKATKSYATNPVMKSNETIKKIWMSAQRLLARREHSRKELQQKLSLKEYCFDDIEIVLNELEQRGWQDDRKFCEAFIRFRVLKGQGPQKIIHDLKLKAVNTQIIAEELKMYDAQWLQLCENVAKKKYGTEPIISVEDRARRFRFLSTRGFTSELIKQVLTMY